MSAIDPHWQMTFQDQLLKATVQIQFFMSQKRGALEYFWTTMFKIMFLGQKV